MSPPNVSTKPDGSCEVFAFPPAPQQQQLWFLDQLDPGNPAYNIPLAYEVRGDLDADALDESLRWVVNRHDTFRTVFAIRGEELKQIVRSELPISFHRVDLRGLPEAEREVACRRAVTDAAAFRFDLANGPLVRGELLLLERARHVVVFNFHHIILDHLSVLQFAHEFCRAYSCFSNGEAPAIPAPALQYPDFAVWQDAQLQEPSFQSDLQEWVRGFDSINQLSTFPPDRLRPRAQTFAGREVKFSMPPDLSTGIRELAKASKKSVYVTLLALFKCLLARYSGQNDVIVGSPFSNRTVSDLDGVMGCCMNTLPLRSHLGAAGTFRELLEIVHRTVLAAYSRQRVPFKLIVDAVKPARDAGLNPLFQSTFTFQDPPMKIALEGLAVTPLGIHNCTSKFDMAIWMWDDEGLLSGLWEYNVGLYDAATIDRLVSNFQALATAAVTAPDTPWWQLDIVSREELRLTNDRFTRTERIWPPNISLIKLIEATAMKSPEAVAVIFRDNKLTYRELLQKANALSRHLIQLGARPESLVGIGVDRSPDMVIAMLAILKAGCAYVPLDLALPRDRLSFMIEDSAIGMIVTNSTAVGQLPPHHGKTVLLAEVPAGESSNDRAAIPPLPDSLAYVRYTSGSTGRPKGVAIPHRALLNFLLSMRERPGCTSRDVLLAVTNLSFDISELEIWLPLLCGGRIVLAAQDQVADRAELLRLMRDHKVTLLQATPATWRLIMDAGWTEGHRLKALCGGEALPSGLVGALLQCCGELWNMYGPTETTVWSTCARISSQNAIHVGLPIANTDVHILDSHLQPVPFGVAGELLIGGDGLARGYLNRPALTAEKFVPHPFKPGAKLYRTGDLAKYLSNGELVLLGRLDSQVKFRGYRIELGEIEAMLAKMPAIRQAVVVPYQEQLATYYISESGRPVDISACRRFLRTWLPDYMVPTIYIHLTKIPLTSSGKVDRKALPSPDAGFAYASSVYLPPRTGTEQKLVEVWQEILARTPIGIRDNFFDLGGNSLLAVSLFTKLDGVFGRRLQLASLFHNPTIAQLALLLENTSKQSTRWGSLVCIRQGTKAPAVFIVHGAGGNILIYRDLARHLISGVSVYGLQSLGLDGHKAPLGTVEEMATSYVEEITEQQPVGPYVLAGYCMGGKIALEMARILKARGQSVAMLAMLDSVNLNIANASSFRSGKLSNYLQLVWFHICNLFARGPRGVLPYLGEKARLFAEAASERLHWIRRNARRRRSIGEVFPTEDSIRAVNDRAGFRYIPLSYPGSVTLFKPRRTYSAFNDPLMGWREVIQGTIDVVELDMNPHAMLVEPFVQELAAEISSRLQHLFPKALNSSPESQVHEGSPRVGKFSRINDRKNRQRAP